MTRRDYLIEIDASSSRALSFARRMIEVEGVSEVAIKTTDTGMNRVAARFDVGSRTDDDLVIEIASRAYGLLRGRGCIVIANIADVPERESRSSIWDPTENSGLLVIASGELNPEGAIDPTENLWDGFPGIER